MENRKIKIKPRIFRIIELIWFFAVNTALYFIFHNYFLWLLDVLIVIMVMVSIASGYYLAKNIEVKAVSGADRVKKGEEIPLRVSVSNPTWAMALDCNFDMSARNIFFGSKNDFNLALPVQPKDESSMDLPLKIEKIGKYEVMINKVILQDFIGMLYFHVPVTSSCTVTALPEGSEAIDFEPGGFLSAMSESEESGKKGSDFSEVSDIREYIPGDRIRDIHWKLSAKAQKLMVKERVSVSGSEMVILMELSEDEKLSEDVLTGTYQIINAFMALNVQQRLMLWNAAGFTFTEYSIGSRRELEDAYIDIFETPMTNAHGANLKGMVRNLHPFLTAYLAVGEKDGKVSWEMTDNG